VLDYFYSQTGIHFDEKKDVVAHKIDSFYKQKGFDGVSSFFRALKGDNSLWQEFVNLLTVNETYFFRETKQIEMMIEFAKTKSRFSILCAPSSSGEEAYTILIMLSEANLLNRVEKLVGVDINSSVIEMARRGVYQKRSLHRANELQISKYFNKLDGNEFEVSQSIRALTRFDVQNIFDNGIKKLGEFDFVFSRNMIIYFDKESRAAAEKALFTLLKPDGKLFLGHADLIPNAVGFLKSVHGGIVCYEKQK